MPKFIPRAKPAEWLKINGWLPVVFAMDCTPTEPDGEDGCDLICPLCCEDYAECIHPGPHMEDEYEYKEFNGKQYARKL